MSDLFMSKQDLLAEYLSQKGLFSKADVIRWGVNNGYISADRVVRKWAEPSEGIVRRLTKDEIAFRGLKRKEASANMAW